MLKGRRILCPQGRAGDLSAHTPGSMIGRQHPLRPQKAGASQIKRSWVAETTNELCATQTNRRGRGPHRYAGYATALDLALLSVSLALDLDRPCNEFLIFTRVVTAPSCKSSLSKRMQALAEAACMVEASQTDGCAAHAKPSCRQPIQACLI